MKKIIFLIAIIATVLIAGCTKSDIGQPVPEAKIITFKVISPYNGNPRPSLRTTLEQGTNEIITKWREGDKINIYFKQGNNVYSRLDIALTDIDGKSAQFETTVPDGLVTSNPYTIYATHGLSEHTEITAGKIFVSIFPRTGFLENFDIPLVYEKEISSGTEIPPLQFEHLGAFQILSLKNSSATDLEFLYYLMVGANSTPSNIITPWVHLYIGNDYKKYDLVSKEMVLKDSPGADPSKKIVPANETKTIVSWFMPTGVTVDPSILALVDKKDGLYEMKFTDTGSPKPPRAALEVGKAYSISAEWDGTALTFK